MKNTLTAERIRILRAERGWTERALGIRIGRSQSIVAQWELGATEPNASSLFALCEAFDVSADYLLGRREER